MAHSPALGVKVYVVVSVLLIAGLQVPLIPLLLVSGNALKAAPEHIGATCMKVGNVVCTMVKSSIAEESQPAALVNNFV